MQQRFEIGAREPAVARFLNDIIAFHRLQIVDDLPAPRAFDDELVADFRTLLDQLEQHLLADVGRLRPAGITQVRLVAELEIDHLHARRARRRQELLVGLDHRSDAGLVDPGSDIEHAALRGIGVLHVDDDDRGAADVDLHIDGARPERHHGAAARFGGPVGRCLFLKAHGGLYLLTTLRYSADGV